MCTKCSENLIGVEFDYLFICSHPEIVNLRVRYQYTELLFEKQQCRKNGWYVVSLSYCVIDKFITFLKGLNRLFS
jgi:hypothetical protein